MTDFESWSKESLVLFAREANERTLQQKAEIEALRADLKAALAAVFVVLLCARLA